MRKIAERLTKISKMKTKKATVKKTAGDMEVAQLSLSNKKRIIALEEEVRNLRKLVQDALGSKAKV